jgi:cytochrome c-type biogenesis protein CcmH/NrfG
VRLSEIVNRNVNTQEVQQEFQDTLARTIGYGQSAVNADPRNYQNWASLAQIYEALIPLQVSGASDNARTAYQQAVVINPTNPQFPLTLARISVLSGDNETAKDFIAQALQLKNNYTDAIFLLSQIEIQAGEVDKAITSVEAASFLAPNDPTILFQLGLLKYSKEDFAGAVVALERAVTINTEYSNARYFLGLSYFQLGNPESALEQFRVVEGFNPDNAEVKAIVANLVAGKSPFDGFEPPPQPIEERETPPIEE